MASSRPQKPSTIPPPKSVITEEEKRIEELTPRDFLSFLRIGTGKDISPEEYLEFVQTTPGGAEIVAGARARIKRLTGIEPAELPEIARKTAFIKNQRIADRTRREVRRTLIKELGFLQTISQKNREAELGKLCNMSNDYIKAVISQYLGNDRKVLPNNEVMICNDPAELTMMAFDDQASEKIKFEAARKLFLMYCFGELTSHTEEQEDHAKALDYMMGFMNSEVIQLPEGARIGEVFDRYLVSEHEENGHKTREAYFTEEYIETDNPLVKITHFPSRRTIVTNEEGEERIIFFTLEPRDKPANSKLTKTFRYGTQIGEKDNDRNGFKLVFETIEDWRDFRRMFIKKKKERIKAGLLERLESEKDKDQRAIIQQRIRNLDLSIIIEEPKPRLGEEDKFDASSKSGSPELKVDKFKMIITLPDGRQYPYEFQIFLPKGYADATYRKGVSWEEYNVRRFFDSNLDQLLFPTKIYPKVNREEIYRKMLKQARRNIWNSNGH